MSSYREISIFDLSEEEEKMIESYKWEMVKAEYPVPQIARILRYEDGTLCVEYTDGEELNFKDGERW